MRAIAEIVDEPPPDPRRPGSAPPGLMPSGSAARLRPRWRRGPRPPGDAGSAREERAARRDRDARGAGVVEDAAHEGRRDAAAAELRAAPRCGGPRTGREPGRSRPSRRARRRSAPRTGASSALSVIASRRRLGLVAHAGGSGSSMSGRSGWPVIRREPAAVGEEAPRPAGRARRGGSRTRSGRRCGSRARAARRGTRRSCPNGPSHGMFVTPDSRPITATSPRLLNRNGSTGAPVQAREDRAGRVLAALDPALGDAGHGPVRLPRLDRGVADHEDLRVAGDRQVRPDLDPARLVGLGAGRRRDLPRERRRLDAGRPQHRPGGDVLRPSPPAAGSTTTSCSVMSVTRVAGPHRHARASPAGAAPTRDRPGG